MKIRDGFKFALGFELARGIYEYIYETCVRKNPKYTRPWRKLTAVIKGEKFNEKEYNYNRKTGIWTVKNKIGFRDE